MVTLGIASATKITSVGLAEDGRVLAEISLSGKEAAAENLAAYISKLAGDIQALPLQGISVITGPGSYSGLRGSLAVAKTLAQTSTIPLVGISTLEAIAYNLVDHNGALAVMTDARRQEFNFALFTIKDKTLTRLTNDLVLESGEIVSKLAKIKGVMTLMGTTSDIYAALQAINPETKVLEAHPLSSYPRGAAVASLGERLIAQGKGVDYLKLAPKYSHKPNYKEWKTD